MKLKALDEKYTEKYNVSAIKNLIQLQKVGFDKWLKEKELLYKCPECGGEICIHDAECFDCGYRINPNIKK